MGGLFIPQQSTKLMKTKNSLGRMASTDRPGSVGVLCVFLKVPSLSNRAMWLLMRGHVPLRNGDTPTLSETVYRLLHVCVCSLHALCVFACVCVCVRVRALPTLSECAVLCFTSQAVSEAPSD